MGQYTINHSDGSTFNIYDNEQNGPNNLSTPRQIFEISLGGGSGFNFFNITGDLTYRFTPGFQFTILDSITNNGTYTTTNSSFDGTYTSISVNEIISSNGLPFGAITYSIPLAENETSLLLSGKGIINFGERLLENFVNLLENFASTSAPINPIVGQLWYKSDTNELFKYDSTLTWNSSINLGPGILAYIDPQHPTDQTNPILEISGDDDDVGLSIKTTVNPNSNDSILRVLSSDNNERLRVEHDGYLSTTNSIKSTGNVLINEFNHNLQFPSQHGLISSNGATLKLDNTNTTWIVSSGNPGVSDSLIVNDSTGSSLLRVRTDNDSVEIIKNLIVDTSTLYVDSVLSNVGIGNIIPSEKLDVTGNIKSSGQFLAANGTAISPGISFSNNNSVGLSIIGSNLSFVSSGSAKMLLSNTGLLSVNTATYETLVLNDNDIPNKKYVDDSTSSVSSSGKLYFFGFGS